MWGLDGEMGMRKRDFGRNIGMGVSIESVIRATGSIGVCFT